MPVSLYEGKAFVVDECNIEYNWCLSFFENEHAKDYLLLYRDDEYKGIITYKSLLENKELEKAVTVEKLFIGNDLWEEARILFDNKKVNEVVPVFSKDMKLLYLAKYDVELQDAWKKLCEMQKFIDAKSWMKFRHYEKSIHIKGINDVLFEIREWLRVLGTNVTVEGELWRWFDTDENFYNDGIVVDKECKWLDSLYLEFCDWLDEYCFELKTLLCKPYVRRLENKEKVLFYLTQFSYFTESIKPLIFRYVQSGQECILVFPNIKLIVDRGLDNIEHMTELIKELQNAGAKCHIRNERELYCDEYSICFLCSEYSGRLPLELTKVSKYVVAIQVTALYTHMYQIKEKFEEVFSEQARKEIDYLVASEYIGDWICERDSRWNTKILRFGYPKLDALYYSLESRLDIPNEWKNRIGGKKVFLFTTHNMEKLWLDYFIDNKDELIAIWRPHPQSFNTIRERKRIEKISERYNIIIDDRSSYDISFQISDALVASLHSSVMVNYLYTEKPVCLYGGVKTYESAAIDYRKEIWYKCAFGTSDKEEVLKFVNRVKNKENLMEKKQILYRKYIMSNFDGEVCNRIYNYFDKKWQGKKE